MLHKPNRASLVGLALLCVATARAEAQDLPENAIIEFSSALDWVKVDGYMYYISLPDDAAIKRIQSYGKINLPNDRAGIIQSCSMGIDVTSGMANSNHSYGAICDAVTDGKPNLIAICDDIHIGWFAAAEVSGSMSERELALFVVKSCVGG
ncbi:hypothetical protein [Dongia sp.]|uniref:hypothetical protein n=1 Tax=Dongia sp. TaxID=1977262 RepID=UPI0035B0072E